MASVNLQSNDGCDDGGRSPERARGVSAPWSKIVSGESVELSPPVVSVGSPAASPAESPSLFSMPEEIVKGETDWCPPDTVGLVDESGGVDAIKKPVWSKPSNVVVEVVSPVMDAVSWPALGESTKAAPKSSSSESLHALYDGSLLPSVQVTGSSSPSSHKPASVNPTSTHDVTYSGQRSMKRGGGSSGVSSSSNGGVSKTDSPRNTSRKPDTVAVDSVAKDHTYKESPRGRSGSQPNSGNDHQHQQNSYRRGNGGPHSRAEGSNHRNYGNKLDQGQGQGRGNQEWNQHRNFNNRDTNMQSQRGGYRRGGYVRPSVHYSAPFIHPPMPLPVRPFGNNVMYPDVASPMVYFQGPPPPMVPGPQYFPFPGPLHGMIVKQIEFYFSNENLVKDTYLRRNMDEQGWVPINLIAGFKKVSSLTDNVQLILDVMRQSTVVEVEGDKIRRRNDWMKWLLPPAVQDSLASQLQGIRLDSGSSSSGEMSSQLQQGAGERAAVA